MKISKIAPDKKNKRVTVVISVSLLWLACFFSAILVVYSTYSTRKSMQSLEELRREANGLKVMSGKFLLEKSSWAAYSRVEQIAEDKLKMDMPQNEETILVYRR